MESVIAKKIPDYWLAVLRSLADEREAIRGRGEIELPPEFERVTNIAVRNFANSYLYTVFPTKHRAVDFATDLVIGSAGIVSVVRIYEVFTLPNECREIITAYEYVVYPGREIPAEIPGIFIDKPIVLSGIPHGNS